MATARARRKLPGTRRLAAMVLGAALGIGLAAGAYSFLSTSLRVPAPAEAASIDELRQRGSDVFYEFCAWPKGEPRWWPECVGYADDWRERGAERLVAFCTQREPSRMFGPSDCDRQDRAPVALIGRPGWDDVAVGGVAAAVALAVGALLALGARAIGRTTRRGSSGFDHAG